MSIPFCASDLKDLSKKIIAMPFEDISQLLTLLAEETRNRSKSEMFDNQKEDISGMIADGAQGLEKAAYQFNLARERLSA